MSFSAQFLFWERTNIEDFVGIRVRCDAWLVRGFRVGEASCLGGGAFEGEGTEESVDLGYCGFVAGCGSVKEGFCL